MTYLFEDETADQVWRAAAEKFTQGVAGPQPGRGGTTKELLRAVFTIRNPRQRWVVSRHPALSPAFAIAEVVWILNGRNDATFLNHWNPRLPKFAGDVDTYQGAYGYRLRYAFGFDQLEQAYRALTHSPDSRQVVLQIWNPATDFPDAEGGPVAADIPCNVCAIPKVRGGKLEWLQIMRSNDVQRGLPYNFVQFTCLQEVLAGWIRAEVGTYAHVSDSLHMYESDEAAMRSYVPADEAENSDRLALPWKESHEVFNEMARLMESIASPKLSRETFRALLTSLALPRAHRNLLLVAAADSARRRGWTEDARELMAVCDNPALVQVWEGWSLRFKAVSPVADK